MSKNAEKSARSKEDEAETYHAYLIARATGETSEKPEDRGWTLGERYAAALGVHHFYRGTKPISMRALLRRVDRACDPADGWTFESGEPAGGLGPSPPDPGVTDEPSTAPDFGRVQEALARMRDALVAHCAKQNARVVGVGVSPDAAAMYDTPGDLGEIDRLHDFLRAYFSGDVREGDSVADVALKLLGELRDLRVRHAELVREGASAVSELVQRAVADERRACAGWLRRWPHAVSEYLALDVEQGKHVREADGPAPEGVPDRWVYSVLEPEDAFAQMVRAGLVVYDSLSAVPREDADVELTSGGAMRGLTQRGREYVSRQRVVGAEIERGRRVEEGGGSEAVANEREACAKWIRAWPDASSEIVAQDVEQGKHVRSPWLYSGHTRAATFDRIIQAGLVVYDPPAVAREDADVELTPEGVVPVRMRGLTPRGREYAVAPGGR